MTGRGITNVTSAHKWFHICHQQPAVSQDVLAGMSNGGFDRRTLYRADLYLVEMFIAGCVTVKHSHGQNVSHIRWTSFGRFHLVEMFTVEAGRCLRCSPQDMSHQQKLHMGKMFITSSPGCGVQQNISHSNNIWASDAHSWVEHDHCFCHLGRIEMFT